MVADKFDNNAMRRTVPVNKIKPGWAPNSNGGMAAGQQTARARNDSASATSNSAKAQRGNDENKPPSVRTRKILEQPSSHHWDGR